jgi:hypothetical protein
MGGGLKEIPSRLVAMAVVLAVHGVAKDKVPVQVGHGVARLK